MASCAKNFVRFVGCDVGKASIVVSDTAHSKTRTIPNQPEALAEFAASLDTGCLVVCEATGGYEAALLAALLVADIPAHRADARKVKAFIRSFGTLAKTDTIDARAIARYARERHADLTLWRARDVQRSRLQILVLLRRDLVKDRQAYANRRTAPGSEPIHHHLDAMIECFKQQIGKVEAEIQSLIETCQPIARAIDALTRIKGVGATTAAALVALLPELGETTGKKIAALAGLAPHPRQSGASDAYRPVRGGRPEIKRALFMAALSARRHNPQLKEFFERLVANGKKRLVAITAVMRKIVTIANAKIKIAAQLN